MAKEVHKDSGKKDGGKRAKPLPSIRVKENPKVKEMEGADASALARALQDMMRK